MRNSKNYFLVSLLIVLFIGGLEAQNSWDARLSLMELDCQAGQATYHLELKSSADRSWHLADQNYRLFFDADKLAVREVKTLLSDQYYSAAKIDQNETFQGEGQEDFSPLDHIDDHLGFLDFSIVLMDKADQSYSVLLSPDYYLPIAEIVMSLPADYSQRNQLDQALNIYFSRPKTAGMMTRQYSIVTEHYMAARTRATKRGGIQDLTELAGWDARPKIVCEQVEAVAQMADGLLRRDKLENIMGGQIRVLPNPTHGEFSYQILDPRAKSAAPMHEWLLYDQTHRLLKRQKVEEYGGEADLYRASVGDLAAGTYLLRVIRGDKTYQAQLVLIK